MEDENGECKTPQSGLKGQVWRKLQENKAVSMPWIRLKSENEGGFWRGARESAYGGGYCQDQGLAGFGFGAKRLQMENDGGTALFYIVRVVDN